jgi:hypothetical protein
VKLETISLKRTPNLTEKWVQDQIAADPSILGLGELTLKDKERSQPHAGRLDLLLQDPELLKRDEVEIQLGATDETHIIRTIEYWDIERKRYPQYEHAAVIVAEEITSRFLNVIQLFNGAIPLIALKMTAYKVQDQHALTFVKVVDELVYGLVDDDEEVSEPTDRSYWEERASRATLAITDHLAKLIAEVEPRATLTYRKAYVGIEIDGVVRNFVTFVPRKKDHVVMRIRSPQEAEIDEQLEEARIDTMSYDTRWHQYRLRIGSTADDKQREVLLKLIRKAWENYGSAVM